MAQLFPNLYKRFPEFLVAIQETLYMLGLSSIFSILIGLGLGILLVITRKKGLYENPPIFKILNSLVNITRSIPFVILIVLLMGVSRLVMGATYGSEGVIIPLIAACVPFYARQVELAFLEVDRGLIEAAHAMGLSRTQIITKVYLKESIPTLTRSAAIAIINLLGLTASVGLVGGGGIGNYAVVYGHTYNETDTKIACIFVIFIIVAIVQGISDLIIKKTKH